MKSAALLLLLMFSWFLFPKATYSQTIAGLRASSSPNLLSYYQDLNAKASRQIIKDHALSIDQIPEFRAQLANLKENGIETIVCLRFPKEREDLDQNDRSPYLNLADMDSSLLWAQQMVIQLNGVLDVIQIQNEPIAGPGKYIDFSTEEPIHLGYYAYRWMDTLGYTLRKAITDEGLNIEVAGPAFHSVENALSTQPIPNEFTFIRAPGDTTRAGVLTTETAESYFVARMMEVSNKYADVIDLHLNVENLEEIRDRIALMEELQMIADPQIHLPYSTYEWSQTKEKQDLILNTPSYRAFLEDAYTNKVTLEEWRSFMFDSLSYDENFMSDAFELFEENEFVHACYAGLVQYGSAINDMIFSTCALLTNRVTDTDHPNEPFYSLYKNLTAGEVTFVDQSGEFNITAYPNPFTDAINIEIPHQDLTSFKILISNIDGSMLRIIPEISISNNDKRVLEISGLDYLDPGVYLVDISSSRQHITHKLIKAR